MRREPLADHLPIKPDKVPPARQPSWGQPAVEEPIIDAARVPLRAFESAGPAWRTRAVFAWLHFVRPALTLALWFIAAWYAWPYVLGVSTQPEIVNLLELYALIVGLILLVMLVMAPLRRRQRLHEHAPQEGGEPSSLFALASYMHVAPTRLTAWQLTKQLAVRHKPDGHLEDAQDSTRIEL